ncbi:MAG: ATP-binding cassette domain-containing protein, partial [Bacteroidales bacterium]|nr:ATP-binding cassette domain-containing protein [Bacteroidales bacterium]
METNSDNVIDVRQLDVYQKNYLILSQVNLSMRRGEFVYLIGKTGTGKSSLLRTLYADLPVQAGEVEVCGQRLDGLRDKDIPYLRRRIGIVFQDFQLLMDRNIHDNLMFVLKATAWKDKAAMERRIEEVLDKVGLKTQAYKMPYRLSGGEQQRVAIARALLNNPELILADAPTRN